MGPAALILAAASAAGKIFGGQVKHIDPEWLRQHFGPAAVSQDAQALFNNLINSPYGQNIMANAAQQGQQFGRDVNRQAAQAGLTGAGGADSGTGIFATSAAQGAGDSLQRGVQSDFYQQVLPIAQNMVNNRMQAYLTDLYGGGYQTNAQRMLGDIGQAAGTIGAMLPEPNQAQTQNASAGAGGNLAMPQVPAAGALGGAPYSQWGKTTLPNTSAMLAPSYAKMNRYQTMFGAVQPGSSYGLYANR